MAKAQSTHKGSRFGLARIAWLRFLDRVKPRPGLGGPSPRVMTASPAETRRIEEILERHRACSCGTLRSNEYRGRDGWWRCFDCDGRTTVIDDEAERNEAFGV